jgi:hypothetical protein
MKITKGYCRHNYSANFVYSPNKIQLKIQLNRLTVFKTTLKS